VRWIRQDPETEDTCGQCCLAMLLSIGKKEAILRIGHDEGTTTSEMARALREAGLIVGRGLRPIANPLRIRTPRALLLGTWRRYPHWMVWNAGKIHDPVEGIIDVRAGERVRWVRVTHYVSVT
jgi:hypothetical protein